MLCNFYNGLEAVMTAQHKHELRMAVVIGLFALLALFGFTAGWSGIHIVVSLVLPEGTTLGDWPPAP